jgi:hypothetical protein
VIGSAVVSRIFGPIRQLGYVVQDIDTAMRHWVEVEGVGPWFVSDNFELPEFHYNSEPHTDLALSVAFANSGELQIELIQQRSNTPSMFTEFRLRHATLPPQGLMQHWSAWPEDYDAVHARALAAGYAIAQQGRTSRVRFAYFRATAGAPDGIEISDNPEAAHAFRARVREAALSWDGSDPVRRM